ncbi:hypothetical protein F4810DRAFT_713352 [Camillea tinctor]|nr:hypothetical protein F4810DRAFT_713352 [Camillea tinctor]
MEALAAVGLAGNIVQFGDFTHKLIPATWKLSNTCTNEHVEISTVVRELQGWVSQITPSDPPQSALLREDEEPMRTLAIECNNITEQSICGSGKAGSARHSMTTMELIIHSWQEREKDL